MLKIENLHVSYGNVEALHGIELEVNEGEIVTILGANGAGKSTTLLTISGLLKPTKGSIFFGDIEISKLDAHEIVKLGIAQVPEGRRVFSTLTVQENLNLGAFTVEDEKTIKKNLEWIFSLFPRLEERKEQLAGTLSGGEQQMLAIARGLMANPKILLLDEPSLGLAPILVKSIFATIKEINQSGVTVLLVEQNAKAALKLAHRGYVMEVGNIVLADNSENLLTNPAVRKAYLGG
ncbi:amino acid/amide ABC transporter ATP-binding protein 2, HAAT family [Desulfonauticus submarinus]|uniref:Amino acid/amide ABC transporter ATP-binding protein 2, HAAT family n=1 Tax=Desulfonauticus submarinus TaxID=206665 RepID=A0A1H0EMR1_9BACT|nr:ABC transporter ATP-binding protein [Desulfonauticus submarinus]SDN83603.1 amino acid/amide ABC transporter ATP-binding protein 2, HAAT family [Desulfonauticus submarinus]